MHLAFRGKLKSPPTDQEATGGACKAEEQLVCDSPNSFPAIGVLAVLIEIFKASVSEFAVKWVSTARKKIQYCTIP